ncbi:MAG TPA: hypothetical protein VJ697_01975 [Nitrososphaeraceae archaeon]|nr:hypothetical protein [Nitrososphaeraceae archaeon]
MHKSTMPFLFVSLLLMLLPFGSSINILSNAMAFNIVPSMNNGDEKQNYMERYDKFYQDNSFRENYYNYHKQHHHNQQQVEQKQQQPMSFNKFNIPDNPYENDLIDMVNDYADKYNKQLDGNNNDPSRNGDGGTGDLTAMEKITKLKKQWLDQLS